MKEGAKFCTTLTTALVICSQAPAEVSNWLLDTSDELTLTQVALNTIKDENAQDVSPGIEFYCSDSGTAIGVQIDWQRFISSFSTEVGFKVDDGRFTWIKWKLDSTEQITRSPSSTDTQKLISLLASGEKLQVEVSPYSQGPITVEFDLSQFNASLEALKSECQQD